MNAAHAVRPGRRANSTPASDHGVAEVADDGVPEQQAQHPGRPRQDGERDGCGADVGQQGAAGGQPGGQPDGRDGHAPQDGGNGG